MAYWHLGQAEQGTRYFAKADAFDMPVYLRKCAMRSARSGSEQTASSLRAMLRLRMRRRDTAHEAAFGIEVDAEGAIKTPGPIRPEPLDQTSLIPDEAPPRPAGGLMLNGPFAE